MKELARHLDQQTERHGGRSLQVFLALAVLFVTTPLLAAPRVELELVMQRGFPATKSHEVLKAVGRVGFDTVRARAERGSEKPSVEQRGTIASPRFLVVGILTARAELQLPGGTFSYRDRAGLAGWLDNLKRGGGAKDKESSAFGLRKSQFEAASEDLKFRVTFNTKGLEADELIAQIGRNLRGPLSITPAAGRALRADDKVRDELKGVSSGTALAAILRPAGCYFKPDATNGSIRYVIDIAAADSDPWPIGWPTTKDERKLMPKAFDWVTVELEDVTVADVLDAIRDRLKIPFLIDHNSLALARIDPAKIKYDQPAKRTYYYRVLSHVLFKARLKSEIRVDERGKAFLWITTLKR